MSLFDSIKKLLVKLRLWNEENDVFVETEPLFSFDTKTGQAHILADDDTWAKLQELADRDRNIDEETDPEDDEKTENGRLS